MLRRAEDLAVSAWLRFSREEESKARASARAVGKGTKVSFPRACARALIRELFVSSADLEPDDIAGTLTIRIHRMASPVHDRVIALLLEDLTTTNFRHPDTGHRFIYQLV